MKSSTRGSGDAVEMRPNKLKRKLLAGQNGFAVTGFTSTDEIDNFGPALAGGGIDALWFDGEHGPTTPHELGDLTRVCDLWGLTSMMRIGGNDQSAIFRHLDRGAQAVVVPHVGSREEAENIVAGGKFPPVGHRGAYFGRQSYGVADYFEHADRESMLVAMIEDARGVENLDGILEVEHIDMLFVGAFDLAASLGYIKDPSNAAVRKVVLETLGRIRAGGRIAGVYTSHADVPAYAEAGASFFMTVARNWVATGAAAFTAAAG